MTSKISRPVSDYLLMILVLFQGLSGIGGGIGLLLDPTGASMNIPLRWLEGSPFQTYLIPGVVLFTVLGLFPLACFVGLLKRSRMAWFGALLLAVALIIWILVEILVIGYQTQPPLQAVYGAVGALMLLLVLLPSVKQFYAHEQQDQQ
ncbi:hypothetical protein GF407_14045 [candidate division KSB1 bacterium]|nr:hypothetical protein [candidate division KSB1 bacterium]